MNLREFLYRVLPDSGVYYAAATDNKAKFKQQAVNSRTELADCIEKYTREHKNAYFATGTFNSESRTAEESKLKKVLHLDLDCGVSKDFSNKGTALREFVKFCKITKLPAPSIITDSGNGIHIYWVLDTPVNPSLWVPLATALQNACVEHDFPVDSKITADSARILRAPESVNYKDPANPKRCTVYKAIDTNYTYDELRAVLKTYLGPATLTTASTVPQVDNDDLSGGVTYDFKPIAKYIFPECAAMGELLSTGGLGNDEWLWKLTLYLLAFCEDGHTYAHQVSDQYKSYSYKETESQWHIQLVKKEKGVHKPTLCTSFAKFMPDKCLDCKHNGHIKSPIALGKPPATELPQRYSQDEYGVMRKEDDELIRIMPYRIEDFTVGYDVAGHGLIIGFNAIISGHPYYIELPHSIMCDVKATSKALSLCGVALTGVQAKEFLYLMTSWTQQMQRAKQVRTTSKSFGWFSQDNKVGFAAADNMYWSDGNVETSIVPYRDLATQYTPVGDVNVWKDIANFVVKQGRQSINVGIASAFSSPLVKFTGVSGLTLALVSEKSGTGKSTALKIAQSAWGDPIKGINALSDTTNSVIRKIGVLKNLPIYWDELRMRDDVEGFIRLMFQLGQGKEKSRLTQNSEFQNMGTWNTLMTAASNESLIDHIDQIIQSSDAGRRRVFELTIEPAPEDGSLSEQLARFKLLESNYGGAGLIYARYLAEHSDEVEILVHKYLEYYTTTLKATNDERFWLAFMAATTAGVHLAKKLNLVDFDVKAIIRFLISEFNGIRGVVTKVYDKPISRAVNYVIDYLNEYSANTATVDNLLTRGCRTNEVTIQPDRKPVMAEIAPVTRWVRIDRTKFTKYVYDQGGQPTVVIEELKSMLPSMKEARSSLGRGVFGNVGGRVRCIDIFMDDEEVKHYFD